MKDTIHFLKVMLDDFDVFQPLTASIITLSDFPLGGDVADWLDAGRQPPNSAP